jgi:hypothetical protein
VCTSRKISPQIIQKVIFTEKPGKIACLKLIGMIIHLLDEIKNLLVKRYKLLLQFDRTAAAMAEKKKKKKKKPSEVSLVECFL